MTTDTEGREVIERVVIDSNNRAYLETSIRTECVKPIDLLKELAEEHVVLCERIADNLWMSRKGNTDTWLMVIPEIIFNTTFREREDGKIVPVFVEGGVPATLRWKPLKNMTIIVAMTGAAVFLLFVNNKSGDLYVPRIPNVEPKSGQLCMGSSWDSQSVSRFSPLDILHQGMSHIFNAPWNRDYIGSTSGRNESLMEKYFQWDKNEKQVDLKELIWISDFKKVENPSIERIISEHLKDITNVTFERFPGPPVHGLDSYNRAKKEPEGSETPDGDSTPVANISPQPTPN